jgi:hypothetical protein
MDKRNAKAKGIEQQIFLEEESLVSRACLPY